MRKKIGRVLYVCVCVFALLCFDVLVGGFNANTRVTCIMHTCSVRAVFVRMFEQPADLCISVCAVLK